MGTYAPYNHTKSVVPDADDMNAARKGALNVHLQSMKIDKKARTTLGSHVPCIIWFTGLSGAGKSTIADLLEQRLHGMGHRTMSLDGDNVRHGLNRDLGFSDKDRVENIRRVAEVGKLMVDAGLITIVSLISPFCNERQMARELFAPSEFFEVFVDTPLSVCEERDPKGLYRKARAGEIANFTGISSAYEAPECPEIRLAAGENSPGELVDIVTKLLAQRNII